MELNIYPLGTAVVATVAILRNDPDFARAYTAGLTTREARIVIRDAMRRLDLDNPYTDEGLTDDVGSRPLSGPKGRELLRRRIDIANGVVARPGSNAYADVADPAVTLIVA